MADEIRNIEIRFDTNATQVNQEVDGLNSSIAQATSLTDNNTVASNSNSKAMDKNSQSVLDNGGAMGLLNMVTGGYAQIVKDSVEATGLFTKNTLLSTAATKINTIVVGSSTGAMKAFRIALAATGVGLLVIGLVSLIANFGKVKDAITSVFPSFQVLTDFIGGLYDGITDFTGITSEASRELEKMGKAAKKAADDNAYWLEINADKYDEYTKRKVKANIDLNKKLEELAKDEELTETEKTNRILAYKKKYNEDIVKADTDREASLKKVRDDAQSKIDAENKSNSEKSKAKKAADAKKAKDDADALIKLRADEESKALKEIQDINDKTEEEKLARQKERDLAEIEALRQKGIDVTNLLVYNTEKYDTLEEELRVKREEETKEREAKVKEKKLEDDKLEAEKEAKFQQDKDNVILASKKNLTDSIASLETIGLTKTKAGQAIAKTLALTQIGIDSAVALSKASTLANAEGVAAQLAFPMVPGVGTIARVASYASTALSVGANIIKAKSLLSSGGGGSISGDSAGASPSVNAGAQPSVSFVASSENQIANSINSNEQSREPIKAYVVSKEISTAQELDRNLIESTTI